MILAGKKGKTFLLSPNNRQINPLNHDKKYMIRTPYLKLIKMMKCYYVHFCMNIDLEA